MANESQLAPTGPQMPGEEAGQSRLAGGGNVIEKLGLLDPYEHCQGVYAYFLARTGDLETALDLLQETFLRAWRHIDDLGGLEDERQRYWLFTVARNALTDHYRKEASRAEAYLKYARDPAQPMRSSLGEPGRELEAREELQCLDRVIRRLPEALRTVLLMQVLAGMSSGQIGDALGRPAGTVRYQVSLARRRLAEEMRLIEEGDDERSVRP